MSKKKKFAMTQEEAQAIVDGIVDEETGNYNSCPVCDVAGGSAEVLDHNVCSRCPIGRYTGLTLCEGTPLDLLCDLSDADLTKALIAFGTKMLNDAGYEIAEVTG